MPARDDDSLAPLRAAIDELAAADADGLLSEARIEARARVRAALTDAFAHSLLEQLQDRQGEPASDAPSADERRAEAGVHEASPTSERDRGDRPARATDAPETSAPRSGPDEYAWYVYGLARGDAKLQRMSSGVDPAEAVTTLVEGALAAVVSRVPLEDFEEGRLREHLADMAWVEKTARAHDSVLNRVREQAAVVPMRMCTVYTTEAGVRDLLNREADSLRDALDQLEGKSEWGVKVFALTQPRGSQENAGAGEKAGAAYMDRIRDQREMRARATEAAAEAAVRIHDRLSALAEDARELPLQRPEVSGHAGEMILNGVYLVPEDTVSSLHAEAEALRAELETQGIELTLTGPWPSYNFVPGAIGAGW